MRVSSFRVTPDGGSDGIVRDKVWPGARLFLIHPSASAQAESKRDPRSAIENQIYPDEESDHPKS